LYVYHTDPLVPPHHDCFFLRAHIRGHQADAFADTGATEKFISADLAQFLGLELHPRKRPLIIRIADFSVKTYTHFVRASVRIGTWLLRMAFVVLPTEIPLVLGMPFFARFEPRITWSKSLFVTEQDSAVHVLSADLLPPVAQLSDTHNVYPHSLLHTIPRPL